eukprot:1161870-Pelagomonas_calceolata.AAC.2
MAAFSQSSSHNTLRQPARDPKQQQLKRALRDCFVKAAPHSLKPASEGCWLDECGRVFDEPGVGGAFGGCVRPWVLVS